MGKDSERARGFLKVTQRPSGGARTRTPDLRHGIHPRASKFGSLLAPGQSPAWSRPERPRPHPAPPSSPIFSANPIRGWAGRYLTQPPCSGARQAERSQKPEQDDDGSAARGSGDRGGALRGRRPRGRRVHGTVGGLGPRPTVGPGLGEAAAESEC